MLLTQGPPYRGRGREALEVQIHHLEHFEEDSTHELFKGLAVCATILDGPHQGASVWWVWQGHTMKANLFAFPPYEPGEVLKLTAAWGEDGRGRRPTFKTKESKCRKNKKSSK